MPQAKRAGISAVQDAGIRRRLGRRREGKGTLGRDRKAGASASATDFRVVGMAFVLLWALLAVGLHSWLSSGESRGLGRVLVGIQVVLMVTFGVGVLIRQFAPRSFSFISSLRFRRVFPYVAAALSLALAVASVPGFSDVPVVARVVLWLPVLVGIAVLLRDASRQRD